MRVVCSPPVAGSQTKQCNHFSHGTQGAPTAFRDLDGLHLMVGRLAHETGVSAPPLAPSPPLGGGGSGEDQAMATDNPPASAAEAAVPAGCADVRPAVPEIPVKEPPQFPTPKLSLLQAAVAAPPAVALPYPRKVLLKFLLRSIAISSYSHGTTNAARPSEVRAKSAIRGPV